MPVQDFIFCIGDLHFKFKDTKYITLVRTYYYFTRQLTYIIN